MYALIKILLIFGLIFFVLHKIGSFFFKIGAASQHFRDLQEKQKKAANDQGSPSKPKKGKFSGGEYVDYEEVK
jgi:hypothetical protein